MYDARDFLTTVIVYLPGEPAVGQRFENVREYTLAAENRVSFVLEDGRSIITTLPFFIERKLLK